MTQERARVQWLQFHRWWHLLTSTRHVIVGGFEALTHQRFATSAWPATGIWKNHECDNTRSNARLVRKRSFQHLDAQRRTHPS